MGETELTLTPAVTCALVFASLASMDCMRSALLVMIVDVEVIDSGPCSIEPEGFLDLITFLKMRFISMINLKVNLKEKDLSIT